MFALPLTDTQRNLRDAVRAFFAREVVSVRRGVLTTLPGDGAESLNLLRVAGRLCREGEE
ncbi:MAG: hypothetical protein V3V62_13180 [bacterium]